MKRLLVSTSIIALIAGQAHAQKVSKFPLADVPFDGSETFYLTQKQKDKKTTWGTMLGQAFGPVLSNALAKGGVWVFPSTGWTNSATQTNAWQILAPLGHVYTCATTQTQCFQEIADQANVNGDSINYACGGEPNPFVQQPFIVANANVNIHALVQRGFYAFGCNITFANTLTGPNFRVNTMLDGATFYWNGQIVGTKDNQGSGESVVVIGPNECPPAEGCGATVAEDSVIFIAAVAQGATSPPPGDTSAQGSLVNIDASGGSVNATDIQIGELNGCGPCTTAGARAAFGVRTVGAGSGQGFIFAGLHVKRTHNVYNGIRNGVSGANQSLYSRNQIQLDYCNLINADNTTGVCIDEFGYFNELHVRYADNASGPYNAVVNLRGGSNQDTVVVQNAVGFGNASPIIDSGSGHSYKFNGNILQEWKGSITNLTPGSQYNYMGILGLAGQGAAAPGTNPTNSSGLLQFTGGTGTVTVNFSHPAGSGSGAVWQYNPWCFMEPTTGATWTGIFTTTSAVFTPSGSITGGAQSRYTCYAPQ